MIKRVNKRKNVHFYKDYRVILNYLWNHAMKIFFNPFGFISGMFFGTVPGCKKGYQSNGAGLCMEDCPKPVKINYAGKEVTLK